MKSLLAAVTLPTAAAYAPALASAAAPHSLPIHRLGAAVAAASSAVVAIFATTSSPVDATMAPDLVRCGRDPGLRPLHLHGHLTKTRRAALRAAPTPTRRAALEAAHGDRRWEVAVPDAASRIVSEGGGGTPHTRR